MITDQDELIDFSKNLLGASFDKVSDTGYIQAATQTEMELRFGYPVTDNTKSYWMVERMRRHILYILMVESAHKFQYKQIHLEHRFKNYIQLIEKSDSDFLKAADDFPELFETGTWDDFAYYLDPGFVYDSLGRDITYSG
jgi:hypothetical protein